MPIWRDWQQKTEIILAPNINHMRYLVYNFAVGILLCGRQTSFIAAEMVCFLPTNKATLPPHVKHGVVAFFQPKYKEQLWRLSYNCSLFMQKEGLPTS